MSRKKIFNILAIEEVQGSNDQESRTYWREVGVGFENRDGSINLKMYMFPGLQLQIREREEKQEQQQPDQRGQDRNDQRNDQRTGNYRR